jgi:hypothetical protein
MLCNVVFGGRVLSFFKAKNVTLYLAWQHNLVNLKPLVGGGELLCHGYILVANLPVHSTGAARAQELRSFFAENHVDSNRHLGGYHRDIRAPIHLCMGDTSRFQDIFSL